MKYTLLDMTQTILSALDSDEINSVSDTVESRQVTQIIRTAYFNIIARSDLPEHRLIYSLDASTDDTKPVLMFKPTGATTLDWIKYNTEDDELLEPSYTYVTMLPLQQFLDYVHGFDPAETNVDSFSITPQPHLFYYKNDVQPHFCTIVQDIYVVFDSFNLDIENTLQQSKTMCAGLFAPTFTITDSFTPDLDEQQFPLLLNEAKSLAFLELKQMEHPKAEMESRRQWRTLQRTKGLARVPSYFDQFPNFGKPASFTTRSRPHVTS